MKKYCVILCNLGGPDSLDTVEPFLYNLFCDPDIITLPPFMRPFQKILAKNISSKRAPKVAEYYKLIGSKSPLLEITKKQAAKLQTELQNSKIDADVTIAMRYWHPMIDNVVAKVISDGYENIILFPLYPQDSITTTGSTINEYNRTLEKLRKPNYPTIIIKNWHDNPDYVSALANTINAKLNELGADTSWDIVFSAHGLPEKLIESGDPYQWQIISTMNAAIKQINNIHKHNTHLSYQSKVGPMKWVGPSTETKLIEIASTGRKNVLVVPIAFVAENSETVYELDIEYKHIADELGLNYQRVPCVNDNDDFIKALSKIVQKNIK